MKIYQYHYAIYLIPLALLLPTDNAQAAFTCTTPTFSSANLGTVPLAQADSANIITRLSYNCTNTDPENRYVSICFGVNGGSVSGSTVSRRLMSNASGDTLPFNMTLKSRTGMPIWGRRNVGGTEFIDYKSVASGTTEAKFTDIIISLLPNNGNTKPGDYTAIFSGANTAVTFVSTTSPDTKACSSAAEGTARFSLTVTAKIEPECQINTTPDIDLGTYAASEKNVTGNNTIGVTCTNSTVYNIGLSPSNGNQNGTGLMKGSAANPTVPYQLQSTDGVGGMPWGNTATSTSVGNGVTGQGSGSSQTYPVYVSVPSADFKPDIYTDTVTINVNY